MSILANVHQMLFGKLITVLPPFPMTGANWFRVECECGWCSTSTSDWKSRELGYTHVFDTHMAYMDEIIQVIKGDANAQG